MTAPQTVTLVRVVKIHQGTPFLHRKDHGMKYPLVLVHWVDSASPSGTWVRPDAIGARGVMDILTSGFQVRKTRDEITIAHSVNDEESQPDMSTNWGGVLTIPRSAVKKVRRLK